MSNVIISNPVDQKKIKSILSEISDSLTRISAEREYIKEAIEALSEDFDLEKKLIRKMANIYHKQNFSTVESEMEELSLMYENIMGTQE